MGRITIDKLDCEGYREKISESNKNLKYYTNRTSLNEIYSVCKALLEVHCPKRDLSKPESFCPSEILSLKDISYFEENMNSFELEWFEKVYLNLFYDEYCVSHDSLEYTKVAMDLMKKKYSSKEENSFYDLAIGLRNILDNIELERGESICFGYSSAPSKRKKKLTNIGVFF